MGKMKERKMEIDEALDKLKEVWYKFPHLRMTQLIDNSMRFGQYQGSAFYYPDEQLINDLENFANNFKGSE